MHQLLVHTRGAKTVQPDDLQVTNQEQARLQEQLSAPIDRYTASDILDYFFGHSEKQNGRWEKVTTGVLGERKSRKPVAA